MKKIGLLVLPIIVLALGLVACGSSGTPVVVSTSPSGQVNPVATTPPVGQTPSTYATDDAATAVAYLATEQSQVKTYKVGDVAPYGSYTLTMNSAQITGTILQTNYTIENKGTGDVTVTLLNFSAKGSDGTIFYSDTTNCPKNPNGTIKPDAKLPWNQCFKGVTTDIVMVYYQEFMSSSGIPEIGWEVSK